MSAQCDDVRERLMTEDEPGQVPELAAHLATCAACRAVMASLVEVDEALGAMPLLSAPPALTQAVIDRVRAERVVAEHVMPVSKEREAESPMPAARLAIAALIAAIVAVVQAPLALLRWLATPRRALLAMSTGVGAAGAVLLWFTLGTTVRSRVPAGDAAVNELPYDQTVVVTETTTAEPEEPAELEEEQGYFEDDGRYFAQLSSADDRHDAPLAENLDHGIAPTELAGLVLDDAQGREQNAEGEHRGGRVTIDQTVRAQLHSLGYYTGEGDDLEADTTWLAELARTEGLALHPRRGWWENTYVPGDPALRVLHRRLASSGSAAALALAERVSPTVPAISAPRDAAIAVGVQADVRAIEGAQRVRVEVGMRAMERAAGRRDPMRIALVIDGRLALDAEAQAHVREVLASLGQARGSRDRVSVHAAGARGGELLALGELRHGELELALRRFFDAPSDETVSASVPLSVALSAAIGSAGGGEGAGLVVLLTPGGSIDASTSAALHAGALAGVPTSAIAIDDGASLADLDAIALAGQGRRRSVSSAEEADRAVREELEAASRIVARALRLELRLGPNVELVDILGSRPLDAARTARAREAEATVDRELASSLGIASDRGADDDALVMYLPAFHAGASHTVLLDLVVRGPGPVLEVDLRYKDLVRLRNGRATDALALARGRASRGPAELRVVSRLVSSELATALAEAGDHAARGDVAAARARIEVSRARLIALCEVTPGLASERSVNAANALAERYVGWLDLGAPTSSSDVIAASLRYAARRHAVIPERVAFEDTAPQPE